MKCDCKFWSCFESHFYCILALAIQFYMHMYGCVYLYYNYSSY